MKDGGWLTLDPATGLIYAAKGNNTGDFYSYSVDGDSWHRLAPLKEGREGKLSKKGGVGAADGAGHIYMVKGSNTSEFWRYDIALNKWERLPDVPAGNSALRVKSGSDLLHVTQYGLDYIYMLKGPKTDFMRYSVQAGAWEVLDDAPRGFKGKWDRGSWLVYDGEGKLYAHKAKVHELWPYGLASDVWESPLPGMARERTTTAKE